VWLPAEAGLERGIDADHAGGHRLARIKRRHERRKFAVSMAIAEQERHCAAGGGCVAGSVNEICTQGLCSSAANSPARTKLENIPIRLILFFGLSACTASMPFFSVWEGAHLWSRGSWW
jgi:hypothetical protein